MLLSVLLPTRERPEQLVSSVSTLLDFARYPEQVQVCYASDSDDPDTAKAISHLSRSQDVHYVMPRLGYDRLHEYCNALTAEATGTWTMMWNDDALMCSPQWDDELATVDPRVILNPMTSHGSTSVLFPIVPSRFVKAVGHWSLNAHTDSWWELIGHSLRIVVPSGAYIDHTPAGSYGLASEQFHGPEMQALREADAATIRRLLA
jgi:hypothetical protein